MAIVIPLIGLFDEPMRPTMRDETVTKKAPKIITSSPNNNLLPIELLGIKLLGNKSMINSNKRLPMPTTLTEIPLSVLGILLTSIFSPPFSSNNNPPLK